jgi:hypothetical protein
VSRKLILFGSGAAIAGLLLAVFAFSAAGSGGIVNAGEETPTVADGETPTDGTPTEAAEETPTTPATPTGGALTPAPEATPTGEVAGAADLPETGTGSGAEGASMLWLAAGGLMLAIFGAGLALTGARRSR